MVTPNLRFRAVAPIGGRVLGYLPLVVGVVVLAPALERARALGGVAIADLSPRALQAQALWLSALTGALLAVGTCTRIEAALAEGGSERRSTFESALCWLAPTAMVALALAAMGKYGTPPQAHSLLTGAALSIHMGAAAKLGTSLRRGGLAGSLAVLLVSWAVPSLGVLLNLPHGPLGLLQPTMLEDTPIAMLLASITTAGALLGLATVIEDRA